MHIAVHPATVDGAVAPPYPHPLKLANRGQGSYYYGEEAAPLASRGYGLDLILFSARSRRSEPRAALRYLPWLGLVRFQISSAELVITIFR